MTLTGDLEPLSGTTLHNYRSSGLGVRVARELD
jgi:hypothetical protein